MKKILYILLFSIGICGCGDRVLNIADPGNFTAESFYKNQSDMDAAVIGAYGKLRDIFNNPSMPFWGEIRSDNSGFYSPSDEKNQVNLFNPLMENSPSVESVWNSSYYAIIAANTVLERVDGATYTNETIKKQHIGEAKLIRALSYFYLARLFGGTALNGQLLGVPKLIQHVGAQEARKIPRASLEDIYQLIVEDLTVAKTNLPPSQSGTNVGRFTSISAQALLGKVYMFMAGFPLLKGTSYYALAATELKSVAENGTMILVPSYIQLFSSVVKNSSEAIIEIQFQSDLSKGTGNSFQSQMLSNAAASAMVPAGDAGNQNNKPTPSILNAFSPGDPRKSVAFRPGYIQSTGSYKDEAYGHKFWQKLGQLKSDVDSYSNWTCNWKELRLAEVYLLYAEALVRTGGDKGVALTYVNKVRARARNTNPVEDVTIASIEARYTSWNVGAPSVSLKDYVIGDFASDTQLLLAIENESRVEFALENKRWYDLVRTGRAPVVMKAELLADENVNLTWNDRDFALPIPQNVMQSAPGAIIQNKGYTQL